jgi:hypothetical protein
MKPLRRLIGMWKREGVTLLPPADEWDVRVALEGLRKPYSRDVVEVFCVTGGMDGRMDQRCLSLWPLERVRRENQARDDEVDVAFADFLIDSFRYEFHYEDAARSSVYGGYNRRRLAECVEGFFELCIEDPRRLDLMD